MTMAMTRSLPLCYYSHLHTCPPRIPKNIKFNHGCRFSVKQGVSRDVQRKINATAREDNQQSPGPQASKPTFSQWASWQVLATILYLFFPFWKRKWDKFLKIEGQVETMVEETAKDVEEVSEVVEKELLEVGQKLPNGKLKDVVLSVEHVSEEAEKDAKLTMSAIKKVDEIKEEVDTQEELISEQEKLAKKGSLEKQNENNS
ncbi:uncharacterized protein LOC143848792 [Tasmannia lanceolata]|uniref:uncharacterized protein LOC143848792 n=1 Tax=Tasmannia lanceolata TaxID=3420 RepID=UPI004063758B